MVQCQVCGKEMSEGKNRNGVPKRHCSEKCRWAAHNKKKFEAFSAELTALFKKYGYIKEI